MIRLNAILIALKTVLVAQAQRLAVLVSQDSILKEAYAHYATQKAACNVQALPFALNVLLASLLRMANVKLAKDFAFSVHLKLYVQTSQNQ